MSIGIYLLRFKGTDKVYIGQSIDIEKRFSTHIYKMKYYKANRKLIEAYNSYGQPTLEILFECEKNELDENENLAIKEFNSVINGFNICETAGGGCDLSGENSASSKFNNKQIIQAFYYLINDQELTTKQISELTGVSKCVVDKISSFELHKWLEDEFPEDYEILRSRTMISRFGKGKTLKEKGIMYPNIISPDGQSYCVENTSQFAKDFGLNNGHLVQVLKGKEKQHKGWKLEK